MKTIMFVLALLFAGTVGAQTANVIELSPNDSVRVQKAWDDLQKAQAKWKDVNDQIDMQYVEIPYDGTLGSLVITFESLRNGYHPRPGFSNGFEFSTDFKYIVPKLTVDPKSPIQYSNGGVVTTPFQYNCLGGCQ